jgi:hypothetical protein
MNKLSGGQLAGGNSKTEKADNDFYATKKETTRAFLEVAKHLFKDVNTIHEPCCGQGHLSEVLKEYFPNSEIVNTDLIDRGYGESNVNFLNVDNSNFDLIITNPPFSLVNDFIKVGLKKTNRYLVYLCKIQLLETVKRKKILENSPLKYVYVHSKRQATLKNGEPLDPNGKPWATTMCLAWFVWDKEYEGEPIIKFI